MRVPARKALRAPEQLAEASAATGGCPTPLARAAGLWAADGWVRPGAAFREGLLGSDRHKALAGTLVIAGRPIVLTSLTIVAGLLVLVFSRFMPILYFGLLVCMALFTTTLGALIILPAVLSLEIRKTARPKSRR